MTIQNNAHEMKIKMLCAEWVCSYYKHSSIDILVNEFTANRSRVRADMMAVTGQDIIAIEIKSEHDSTSRLEKQIAHLKKLHNRVEVVVAENHLKSAEALCRLHKVGLHIARSEAIETILRGRRRKIETDALYSVFPQKIRKRSDFEATEAYYIDFIVKKYKNPEGYSFVSDLNRGKITESFIRNLNPSFRTRKAKLRIRDTYLEELKRSFELIQSTQSSSNSSVDMVSP